MMDGRIIGLEMMDDGWLLIDNDGRLMIDDDRWWLMIDDGWLMIVVWLWILINHEFSNYLAPKLVPRGSKMRPGKLQNEAWRDQNTQKCSQEGPRWLQDAPREGKRGPNDRSRPPKCSSKTPTWVPRGSQNGPKWEPKWVRNRWSNSITIFIDFSLDFELRNRRFLIEKQEISGGISSNSLGEDHRLMERKR